MKRYYIILLVAVLFAACDNRTVFTEFRTLPLSGWNADSALVFNVEMSDTAGLYDVIVDVRHAVNYPYQNMWLFVNNDTIDFYLANQRGEWLGNGGGDLREMPVLYKQAVRFDSVGTYTYTIIQGMRDKNLKGISDVGLQVVRHE